MVLNGFPNVSDVRVNTKIIPGRNSPLYCILYSNDHVGTPRQNKEHYAYMYVSMVTHLVRVWINRSGDEVANPARGQLKNRKN